MTKLEEGERKGLADDSRAFLASDEPAGTIKNFRPLGEVVWAEPPPFGVFGLACSFAVALKLSSPSPSFRKPGLS